MPSVSSGFIVAVTRNGSGNACDCGPIVTWRSCIASSKADCTLAGARLISSASTTFAKIGPSDVREIAAALVENARSDDVARKQVGRELNALERSAHGARERATRERFREPGWSPRARRGRPRSSRAAALRGRRSDRRTVASSAPSRAEGFSGSEMATPPERLRRRGRPRRTPRVRPRRAPCVSSALPAPRAGQVGEGLLVPRFEIFRASRAGGPARSNATVRARALGRARAGAREDR